MTAELLGDVTGPPRTGAGHRWRRRRAGVRGLRSREGRHVAIKTFRLDALEPQAADAFEARLRARPQRPRPCSTPTSSPCTTATGRARPRRRPWSSSRARTWRNTSPGWATCRRCRPWRWWRNCCLGAGSGARPRPGARTHRAGALAGQPHGAPEGDRVRRPAGGPAGRRRRPVRHGPRRLPVAHRRSALQRTRPDGGRLAPHQLRPDLPVGPGRRVRARAGRRSPGALRQRRRVVRCAASAFEPPLWERPQKVDNLPAARARKPPRSRVPVPPAARWPAGRRPCGSQPHRLPATRRH
jgi:hypothetical protein